MPLRKSPSKQQTKGISGGGGFYYRAPFCLHEMNYGGADLEGLQMSHLSSGCSSQVDGQTAV